MTCIPPLVQIPRGEYKQVPPQNLSGRLVDAVSGDKKTIKVDIADIISVSACADLTLPPGAGLCIDTSYGSVYLVSNSFIDLGLSILYKFIASFLRTYQTLFNQLHKINFD